MSIVLSTCGGCGCGCGVYLYEDKGKIRGVSPVRNHPVSKGNLCVKGWNIHQSIENTERLKKPLIKENGSFREAAWEEAINFVVKRFKEILSKESGKGIGVVGSQKITNEENYSLMKFARTVLVTNNVDNCGNYYYYPLESEPFRLFNKDSIYDSIDELQEDDVVFLVCANPVEENPQIGTRILQAVKRGAKLFIMNQRKVKFKLLADAYLLNVPGSEFAVINGILRSILEDRENSEGSELYSSLELYSQEFVEEISGVNFEELNKIVDGLENSSKNLIFFSSGLILNEFFADSVNSILHIAKFVNSRVYSLGGQNNGRGAAEMGVKPNILTDYQSVDDKEVKKKFKKVWKKDIPSGGGYNVFEMLEEALKYNLKGMYIVGEDLVVSLPDVNRTKKALSNLDFLVVQDMFMSETAKFADVVLPAASFAEKDGTYINLEGRVQRVKKAIEPKFDSKSDLQIFNLIEGAFINKPAVKTPEGVMKEISSVSLQYKNINYKGLDEGFGLMVDVPSNGAAPTTFPVEKKYMKTPESPDIEFPYYLITNNTTFCHNSGTLSKYSNILKREFPLGFVEINPKDAREVGIRGGQLARVISRRGELELPVKLNPEMLAGTVFIPLNYRSGTANVLTGTKVDIKLKRAGCKSCTVRLEKV